MQDTLNLITNEELKFIQFSLKVGIFTKIKGKKTQITIYELKKYQFGYYQIIGFKV